MRARIIIMAALAAAAISACKPGTDKERIEAIADLVPHAIVALQRGEYTKVRELESEMSGYLSAIQYVDCAWENSFLRSYYEPIVDLIGREASVRSMKYERPSASNYFTSAVVGLGMPSRAFYETCSNRRAKDHLPPLPALDEHLTHLPPELEAMKAESETKIAELYGYDFAAKVLQDRELELAPWSAKPEGYKDFMADGDPEVKACLDAALADPTTTANVSDAEIAEACRIGLGK